MYRIILICLLVFLSPQQVFAAESFLQADPAAALDLVSSRINPDQHDHGRDVAIWHDYLQRPHPDVATLRSYFTAAATEFGVHQVLLEAIGQVESNWTQIGPSIDRGWGIMHLVENNYSHTLTEAAELLQLDPQILKDDPRQNIRGAAALLARYAGPEYQSFTVTDWFPAAARFSGLVSDDLRWEQARRYYQVITDGVRSNTIWGETIELTPHPDLEQPLSPEDPNDRSQESRNRGDRSEDYSPAITYLTPCNYQPGRNHLLDTWVNHWIGVGTYAGAISWFHNCSAQVSAHFVIRNHDGEITQVVRVANTAWHCGAYGYPYNNSRSIGVEHEATLANPDQWSSVPMLEASTLMAKYFCYQYDIPMQRVLPGIQGHNDMPGTNTLCPGNLPWALWLDMLNSPTALPAGTTIAAEPTIFVSPNPFNPRTTLRVTLPAPAPVHLAIHDATGRVIRVLLDGVSQPQHFQVTWDGQDRFGRQQSTGIYLARLRADNHTRECKLVLLK